MQKLDALTRILEAESFDGMIIFARTKLGTEELAGKLQARGFSAAAINGDINQQQRERTIQMLKDGNIDILVFHIQKPNRTAMPAPDNTAAADITCTLQARGTTLHYTKTGTGNVLAEETLDKDLIRDVE